MTTWFTSDTHYGHVNILTYCSRPFRDVKEMNSEMIRRWNERVQPGDTVYHLGDFAFGKKPERVLYRPQLAGRIVLVVGNHDRSCQVMREDLGFDEAHKELTVQMEGKRILLTHKPQEERPGYDLFLNGHVHEKWRRWGNRINVGVDQWDFRPVTLQELMTAFVDTKA